MPTQKKKAKSKVKVKSKKASEPEMKLGPKGKQAYGAIVKTMTKFRTDERKRMIGYVQTWVKKSSAQISKHA